MTMFLNNQTTFVMAICVIGGLLLLSLSLTWLVIRFSGERLLRAYAGLMPPVGAMLMAGFVLSVALVVSSVMRDGTLAEQSVDSEAHALHLALAALDKEKHPLWHQAIATYIDKVVNEEWQDMRSGIRSQRAHDALLNLRLLALKGLPGISPEERRQLLDVVNTIDSSRQGRLFASADEVPEQVWAALWISALVTIFFCAAVHARNPPSAYILAALYGMVIGSMFFTIVSTDHPFLGPGAVSNQPIASLAAGT